MIKHGLIKSNRYVLLIVPYGFIDQIITEVYIGLLTMKKALHPTNYRPVVFQDLNNGQNFLTRSTVESNEVITIDGVEYPLVKVHISSASHPFFTGEERIVDVEGRVDKFKARAAAGQAARERRAATAIKQDKRKIDRRKETEAKHKAATNDQPA